jgi:hypothetical protein
MNTIKIVRLKNGEDIVGQYTANGINAFDIVEPMTVGVEYRGKEAGLVMRHWLPVQLVKKNEITLNESDILCVIEPDNEFVEYYMNTVEKIHDLLKAKNLVDEMSDEEIDLIMNEFEDMDNNGYTLH